MLRFFLTLALLLALAPDAALSHGRHRRVVRAHGHGRVLSPVPSLGAPVRPRPQSLPDFTQRPVLPGQTPPPAYLLNNAPPVFAPQPMP
ncbi:MAG: hypothetical protein KGM15_03825 [Pseudomonadota bacterium]|nr:hypothetical protein [Pseudomonadota bacterium]